MVPPWVPDVDLIDDQDAPDSAPTEQEPPEENPGPVSPPPVPIAPPARFGSSRRSFNEFARSGSIDAMRRGVQHYVGTGLGGSGTATRRFGGTVRTARLLYSALSATASGQPAEVGSPLDPTLLEGRSAADIMDAVVEAVRPVDGTQDAEANRDAIRNSLSELLSRFPEADLLRLSDEERQFVIERYVGFDVYTRIALDVGKTIQDNSPNPAAALARLQEVREYIKETVSASFRRLQAAGQLLNAASINQMITEALERTFDVFEAYT